jgi:hypothetical protein
MENPQRANGRKREPTVAKFPDDNLHSASERGNVSVINRLLDDGADINQRDQVSVKSTAALLPQPLLLFLSVWKDAFVLRLLERFCSCCVSLIGSRRCY